MKFRRIPNHRLRRRAPATRGAALFVFALVLSGVLVGGVFLVRQGPNLAQARDRATSEALGRAKDALIGFAATYRDQTGHRNQVFGFLPCPDTNGDGIAEPICGIADASAVGLLPWKTLNLAPLRDSADECLWYVVSGHVKDSPKTAGALNWDTMGQLRIAEAGGATLTAPAHADLAWAAVLAPHAPIGNQARRADDTSECGGSTAASAYLEGLGTLGTATTSLILASPDSRRSGTNNDRAAWITGREIFALVERRADFKTDIDTLMDGLSAELNRLPPHRLPRTGATTKGVDPMHLARFRRTLPATGPHRAILDHWRDQLLFAGGPGGRYFINGSSTPCRAVLLFGGARSPRTVAPLVPQTRISAAEKEDATMYLEGQNAEIFPANGAYVGATQYDATVPGADLIRCINGTGSGEISLDSPADVAALNIAGTGARIGAARGAEASDGADPSQIVIAAAAGSTGGCVWSSQRIPLAGKTLRAYTRFRFFYGDTAALGEPVRDRGNGFTLQLVREDIGMPTGCGSQTAMGALGPADMWGSRSFLFETDIRRDRARNDPAGNHTAIMTNGYLAHAPGTANTACDGSSSVCQHTPTNRFEESPNPRHHHQRIEIVTGCNANCSVCTPAAHTRPQTYARLSAWVDCDDCDDITANLDRLKQRPAVERCSPLDEYMNAVFVGLTAGFRSAPIPGEAPDQGVIIDIFRLRSD